MPQTAPGHCARSVNTSALIRPGSRALLLASVLLSGAVPSPTVAAASRHPVVKKTAPGKPVLPATTFAMTVYQPLVAGDKGYPVYGDRIMLDYVAAHAGPVTVGLYSSLPLGFGARWYAAACTQVAQLKSVAHDAGPRTFSIKLSEIHVPDAPLPGFTLPPRIRRDQGSASADAGAARPGSDVSALASAAPKEGDPGYFPGSYVVELDDGRLVEHVALTIHPAGATVAQSRVFPSFMGAVRDSHGLILAADRGAWRGRRYSRNWLLQETYPKASVGQSSDPVDTFDAAVDSHDNLFLMTPNGVYRYTPDGNPAPWAADSEYINYPYPSVVRNLLGARLDPNAKGKKDYVFGPGGGGGHRYWNTAETIDKPGFAFQWGGLAIDSKDNIYVGMIDPKLQIEVFDNSGKYERTLQTPAGSDPRSMRFGKDGALWVQGDRLARLDPDTGAVQRTIEDGGRFINVGPDGTLYAYNGPNLHRYTPAGDPLPFTTKAPYVRDNGAWIDLRPSDNKMPDDAPGCTANIMGLVGADKGDFYISATPTADPNGGYHYLEHFAADGAFVPDNPAIEVHPHETGNVFETGEPARVDVQLTNIRPDSAAVTLDSTTTNLDSTPIGAASVKRTVPALTSVSAVLDLGVKPGANGHDVYGYYQMRVGGSTGGQSLPSTTLYGGRVTPRTGPYAPYSPFGSVRMEANPELIRRAGGGLNRNHNPVYWNDVEPHPGDWHLQPPDALDFYRAHSMPAMTILAYGEPWDNGGFARCRITSYDAFWSYASTGIDQFKGGPMIWQFWNEPNYFWHVPGPYSYEHYAMVLQGMYSIEKALDPQTPLMCDGFAGSASMMGDLAKLGAAGFTDLVPVHYPGAKTLSFDNMPITGSVESKASMVGDLSKIRDVLFPGKPLYNTEEGLWGMQDRTPRSGAELLPRIYVSQMAQGLDRLTWFECFSKDDPTYLLRSRDDGPWPAYFAYSTASKFLENAQYVGPLSDGLAQVHLFAVDGSPVIVAWSVDGKRSFTLAGLNTWAQVTDWQGNTDARKTTKGKLTLELGPSVQYVTVGDMGIFSQVVVPRIVAEAKDPSILHALSALSYPRKGDAEILDLNALFHAARLAEVQALYPQIIAFRGKLQQQPHVTRGQADAALQGAIVALRRKEADGSYLRDAHTALDIARRSAYFMDLPGPLASGGTRLAPAVQAMARQVELRAATEKPWYPGVMLRVALDTSAIRQKTPAGQPLDEQFQPQIGKKPGDPVEVEMTVYNWTKAMLTGSLTPVLPPGWKPAQDRFDYTVEPMKFARFTTTTIVPPDAADGLYPIGVQTEYKATTQRELHTYRVEVKH